MAMRLGIPRWAFACILHGVCCAALLAAAPQQGGPATLNRAGLDELVALLADPDWSVREAAGERLREARLTPGVRLEPMLARPDLEPEQRLRLEEIARERFAASPRAGLGVRQNPTGAVGPGVRVAGTVEGFDADRVLAADDLLVNMDGVPVRDWEHLRAIIISYDPGERVPVVVLRRNEPVETVVEMGRLDGLADVPALSDYLVRRAFEERIARIAPAPSKAVIDEPVAPDGAPVIPAAQRMPGYAEAEVPGVAVGEEARGRDMGPAARFSSRPGRLAPRANNPYRRLGLEELRRLQQDAAARQNLRYQELQQAGRQASDTTLPAAEQRIARERLMQAQIDFSAVREEMELIREALTAIER